MIVVRYADDLVAGFEHEGDARRFLDAMRERFEAFSLSVHPDKTRLIEFGRHAAADRKKRGVGRPETFAFLGFIFICGKSRRRAKNGNRVFATIPAGSSGEQVHLTIRTAEGKELIAAETRVE
jgi:hypothetical protein